MPQSLTKALILLLAACVCAYDLTDFRTQLFKFSYPSDNLYDVDIGFNSDALIVAFGDLDYDKATDIITMNTARDVLTFYTYSRSKGIFLSDTIRPINLTQEIDKNAKIDGVVLVSWTSTAKPDLMVTSTKAGATSILIFKRNENQEFTKFATPIPILAGSQPFLADIDGDFYTDIIFTNENKQRVVMRGNAEGNITDPINFSEFVDNSSDCLSSDLYPFSSPHSTAFLDLNGDCLSDLFFTSQSSNKKYHEVWLNKANKKYCLTFLKEASKSSSQVSFLDYNRDGRIDFMFAVKNELYLYLNKLPVPDIDGEDCVAAGFTGIYDNSTKVDFEISSSVVELYSDDVYAATIRMADYNLDGYSDLLFTWKVNSTTAITYLCETASDSSYNSCKQISTTARVASFFDLEEDGKPDIILSQPNENTHETKAFYQYYNRDAFILKVMQLQDANYGGIYYGTEFTYIYTDLNGGRHAGIGFQSPQNAYNALQMPYGLVGIGRSSNYIEHLSISYPIQAKPNVRVWSPIIPNSQIIIKSHMGNSKKWAIELFVSPSSKLTFIIVIVVVLLVILICIIFILYYREKKEDEASGAQINFLRI